MTSSETSAYKEPASHARLRSLQIFSLLVLVAQNAALVLIMRYARTRAGDMFMSTSAVVSAEVMKLVFCLIVIFYEHRGDVVAFGSYICDNTVRQPLDCLKICVPAVIYVLQNNLLYVALSNLDTAVFQVTYQIKILTTALFSVSMLQKKLTVQQWIALILLASGVGIVQVQVYEQRTVPASGVAPTSSAAVVSEQSALLGLTCILASCVMSGFAGVYFEKLLKHTSPSIFLRNVQLGVIGVVFGILAALLSDGSKLWSHGFFFGYDYVVWMIVGLQSLGGIMVAVVIKYTDNILKGFATSAAIVVTCVLSVFLFDTVLSPKFTAGAALVVASIYIYGRFVHVPLNLPK